MLDLSCFDWVQLIKKTELPANAKYLALYLSTFMNRENDVAWPSMRRISHETGLSIQTSRKWLDFLDEKDWLIKRRSVREVFTTGGPQLQNEYLTSIPDAVLRQVNDLLPYLKGGQAVNQRGVNESPKGGKQLAPNNKENNNVNNNLLREKKKEVYKDKTLPPWSDDQGFEDLGLKLGLFPRPGETWNNFKNRVKIKVIGE